MRKPIRTLPTNLQPYVARARKAVAGRRYLVKMGWKSRDALTLKGDTLVNVCKLVKRVGSQNVCPFRVLLGK